MRFRAVYISYITYILHRNLKFNVLKLPSLSNPLKSIIIRYEILILNLRALGYVKGIPPAYILV